MKCAAVGCEQDATWEVLKHSVFGDVALYMCEDHCLQLGPHQRSRPIDEKVEP